jgi:hypothetical protein
MMEVTKMTEIPKEIAEALFATAKAVADNPLVKDMSNEFAKFKYVPIDSYYAAIPPLALQHGLFWRCRETEVGGEGKTFKFQYAFDLIHEGGATVEGYDIVTIYHPAQGAQSSGSARSYADKLFMRTAFKCVTGEKDSEFFNREPEEDFDLGDADATDNSDEEVNAKQLEDATKIEQPKPVADKPKKNDAAAPMSLEEWRSGLLDHPENPVIIDGGKPIISGPTNSEGANLILKTIETFMPRLGLDERSPMYCKDAKEVNTMMNEFYKVGTKNARKLLNEIDPKNEDIVLGYFKAAKTAANNGETWKLEE